MHMPLCHPVSSRRWDVRATWSRSSGGGATTVGVGGFRPSMVVDGPREPHLPKSHEEACVEWAAHMVESGAMT